MSTTRHDTAAHVCLLGGHSDDMIKNFIDSGPFVNFRRKVKRHFMISIHHPLTSSYIKSISELRWEEKWHLMNCYYMIHPLSMFNFWWRFIVFISLWTEYTFWPIVAPYVSPMFLLNLFFIHNAVHGLLIPLSFFLGYYNEKKKRVVLSSSRIGLKYISTYFLFDVIAFGTVVLRLLLTIYSEWDLNSPVIRILRWTLPLFKYARYPYFLDSFREIRLYFRMTHFLYLALKNACNLMFFLLFTNTVLFVILREFSHFSNKDPIKFAVSSLEMIFLINHGHHILPHIVDKITPIICISMGFVLHLTLHVYVMRIWFQFYSAENTQNSLYYSLSAYMKYKALPNEMKDRIFLYLDFKYQKFYYKDSSIMLATSAPLRKEILVSVLTESTSRLEIFKNIPENVIKKLRGCMVPVIFLPGDIIVKAGTQGRNMFFILRGTVIVTTPTNNEVYRLRDGSNFGEISLLLDLPRIGNATAATPCEVYVLNQKHFFQILNVYPQLLTELMVMAKDRFAKMTQKDKQDERGDACPLPSVQDDDHLMYNESIRHHKLKMFK